MGITPDPRNKVGNSETLAACFYLFSLFVVDYLQWVVSRLMRQEILEVAILLDYSEVKVSLILSTADVLMAFIASYAAPRLAVAFINKRHPDTKVALNTLNCKQLAYFAHLAYFGSAIMCVVFYGVIGFLILIGGLNDFVFYLFIIFWVIQYPFTNQLGDQAVQMSLPHWIYTFKNTMLGTPQWLECCCSRFSVPSSPRTLSLFSTLVKVFILGAGTIIYIGLRDTQTLRWVGTLIGAFVVFVVIIQMLYQQAELERGVVVPELQNKSKVQPSHFLRNNSIVDMPTVAEGEEPTDEKHNLPSPSEAVDSPTTGDTGHTVPPLPRTDLSLIAFSLLVLELPKATYDAILAILALQFNATALLALACLGSLVVVLYLFLALRKSQLTPSQTQSKNSPEAVNSPRRNGSELKSNAEEMVGGGKFTQWLQLLWIMIVLLTACALCFQVGSFLSLSLSLPLLLVYTVTAQAMKVRFVGHMFLHPAGRSARIQFWINVLKVFVNGPLMAIYWVVPLVLEDVDWLDSSATNTTATATASSSLSEEEVTYTELVMVMSITICIFIFTGIWYLVAEPLYGERGLGSLINSMSSASNPDSDPTSKDPAGHNNMDRNKSLTMSLTSLERSSSRHEAQVDDYEDSMTDTEVSVTAVRSTVTTPTIPHNKSEKDFGITRSPVRSAVTTPTIPQNNSEKDFEKTPEE